MAKMKYMLFLIISHEYLVHITFLSTVTVTWLAVCWRHIHVQDAEYGSFSWYFGHTKYQFLHHGTKLNVLFCL